MSSGVIRKPASSLAALRAFVTALHALATGVVGLCRRRVAPWLPSCCAFVLRQEIDRTARNL
jgi:hypothetical protein